MRSSVLSVIAVPAVLLLAACAPVVPPDDPAGLALRVDREAYRPGQEIQLTLANRSNEQVGYNLCASGLDRRSGNDWDPVPEPLAEACTMELRTLQPGGSDTFPHTLPATLQPGEYRIRTGVEWPLGGSRTGVATPPFRVAG